MEIFPQALENKPITIYGTGEQTRSFQYVSDLVQGLVTLMASDYILPVNIGNPEERSIKTFATLIREMVGSDSEIVNRPEVEDDPQKRRPDISTAAKVIIISMPIILLMICYYPGPGMGAKSSSGERSDSDH